MDRDATGWTLQNDSTNYMKLFLRTYFFFTLYTASCLALVTLHLTLYTAVYASPVNFTVEAGSTFTLSTDNYTTFEVTGTVTINGTLEAGKSEIKVGERWEKDVAGKFDCGTSTVTFYTTTISTFTGQTTFYCLSCVTAGKELQFTQGTTQWITTTFTMEGLSGNTVKLRSTTTGGKWAVTFYSTQTVNYIDVKDSDANLFPVKCQDSANSGNINENWVFPPNAPTGLTQLDRNGTALTSMFWTKSNLIISSFTLSTPNPNNTVRFYLQVSSVTSGNSADWTKGYVVNCQSGLLTQGTTGYQWPTLTSPTTYWWQVWSENKLGVASVVISTTLAIDLLTAKLGFETELSVDILISQYSFGEVAIGASTQTIASVGVSSIQVQNTGNIPETFALKCGTNTLGSPWYSIETSSGYNNYLLRAVFHSLQPAMADFSEPGVANNDIVADNEYRTSGADRYSVDGSQTGVSVPPYPSTGNTKNLWLRLDMPTSSGTGTSQEIKLYIRAESP
ncbi:MAG: hypothetical protein V1833_03700 [Elusimicrobiota bacterium]